MYPCIVYIYISKKKCKLQRVLFHGQDLPTKQITLFCCVYVTSMFCFFFTPCFSLEYLKGSNLSNTSAKEVRLHLEDLHSCDFTSRKKKIDNMIMDYVNSQNNDDDDDDDAKSKSESESEDEKPKRAAASKPSRKRKAKPEKSKPAEGVKRKSTGFTRPYQLSEALASVVGGDTMARHEVVKKIWERIKEKNLYDPKNKQFAICDPELQKVMGVKRFRTFGMVKYLKNHFLH